MTTTAAFLDHVPATLPAARALAADAPSRRARIAGRCLGGLAVLFLAFDLTGKLLRLPVVVEGTAQLGYPPGVVFALGIVQLVCLALYLVPRTAPLGAVLWTGYLGGAIATHVRVENPLWTHTLFPIYLAALLWGSLWLRDRRVRGLLAG
jgi:hypothetical protein